MSVTDTGVGISTEMLPCVFDLFSQVDQTLGRAQGGLGIGLALVRNLVGLHGGEVKAYSDGDDKGSCFVVRLPLLAAPSEFPSARNRASTVALSSRRVLIIDDTRDAADSLALLLEKLGRPCASPMAACKASKRFADFQPDLIFLDIGMPKMDGYETARRIRELPEGCCFERSSPSPVGVKMRTAPARRKLVRPTF